MTTTREGGAQAPEPPDETVDETLKRQRSEAMPHRDQGDARARREDRSHA